MARRTSVAHIHPDTTRVNRRRRLMSLVSIIIGVLFISAGITYYGWLSYLRWFERHSPSTARVLKLRNGLQVPLNQPLQPGLPPDPHANAELGRTISNVSQATPVSLTPLAGPVLPPERLRIPRIGLDRPTVLSYNEQLPRFSGVGWLLGSAAPGAQGNMVLFGHLGGPFGVFERLHELVPGDELIVTTQHADLRYLVETIFETTPDDVSVLVPAEGATATLITCSGPWDVALQSNERRLVVVARLAPAKP